MLKASNILQRVFNAHILTFWLRRCGLFLSKFLRSALSLNAAQWKRDWANERKLLRTLRSPLSHKVIKGNSKFRLSKINDELSGVLQTVGDNF